MTETEYLEMRHYVEEAERLQKELKQAYNFFFEEREAELAKSPQESKSNR